MNEPITPSKTPPDPHPCYNRAPFKDKLLVQDGYYVPLLDYPDPTGAYPVTPRKVLIDDRNSKDCQYTQSKKTNGDPRCTKDGVDCPWKSLNPIFD